MNRLTDVLRRIFGSVRVHVGTDHLGNKYYSIPEHKSLAGKLVRAKRMVVAANLSEHEYIEGSIPTEWDAWIRGRRKEPPSIEELLKNESQREQLKVKARVVEEKDLALRAKEYEQGLVMTPKTVAKGHASAANFGEEKITEDPTSTAGTFQPGSWMPTSNK